MIKSVITIMIPILFAAMGGLFPALAGTLNTALEGLLLIGAFSSLAIFYFSGSIPLAVAAAAIAGISLSAVHAFAAFKLKANNIIAGLAVNLLSAGICAVLSDIIFKTKGVVSINYIRYHSVSFGEVYLFSALFLLVLMWLFINKTPYGFRLRACDKDREALISLSINPQKYQIFSILFSGLICGLGGSFLSLNLGSYVPGMSAGKGWIALVIIYIGFRKPQGLLAAAFVFALAEAFSNHAQGFLRIPKDLMLAFPYACALIAIIAVSIIFKNKQGRL